MARSKEPRLAPGDASVTPLGNLGILFVCGDTGTLVAAEGIEFRRLKLPPEQGKIIKVSSTAGFIEVKQLGDTASHKTELVLTKDKGPDEMHIRIPIGVRFFKITISPDDKKAGYDTAFFFQAGDGYNILPHHLPIRPMNADPDQSVQELVLITSHVPPRRGPIRYDDTEPIPELRLNLSELVAVSKPDAP